MQLSDLKNLASRLKATTPDVMREQTLRFVRKYEDIATAMNTDQLFEGKLANGEDLPDYSMVSVQKFGKRPGPWQLYETGAFYRGFFVDAITFPIIFGSKDLKTGFIADAVESKGKNADEIFGLNKQNLSELGREYVLPDLQNYLRGLIQLR